MRRSIASIVLIMGMLLVSSMVTVAQDDMAQSHKQTYLNVVAEYNAGNREAFYNMVSDPFMMNQGDATLYETSSDDIRMYDGALAAAMPDLQMNADVVIAQGDWIATHVTYTGTFTEPFSFPPFGPDSFPANNAVITWTEMNFLHFNADGLVDTLWLTGDPTVQFGQMGIFPSEGNNADGTPLDAPAGYQALSADELAATYTSAFSERNAGLFQALVDNGLTGDTAAFYADPYVSWNSGVPYSQDSTSFEEDAAFFGMIASAMPDYVLETPVVVAEGDWVAVLLRISGTFTEDADFMGMTLSATGQPIVWQIGNIDRYDAEGTIVEEFVETDPTPLLIGLGIMPPMGE